MSRGFMAPYETVFDMKVKMYGISLSCHCEFEETFFFFLAIIL